MLPEGGQAPRGEAANDGGGEDARFRVQGPRQTRQDWHVQGGSRADLLCAQLDERLVGGRRLGRPTIHLQRPWVPGVGGAHREVDQTLGVRVEGRAGEDGEIKGSKRRSSLSELRYM